MSNDLPPTVIFFDGVCNLCNGFVSTLISLDRHKKLRYASLQGATAVQQLGQQEAQALGSIAVLHQGKIYRESGAVLRIMKSLGTPYAILAFVFGLVPNFMRNMAYRLVARHRYKWFGQKEFCRMPAPEEQDLFLP
ncbi:MAG: thiol-disulfide oxidoreductase DCC family protein [Bdellovibrionales bacterium]